jgi:hypothetical protein
MHGMSSISEALGPKVMFDMCAEYAMFWHQKNSGVLVVLSLNKMLQSALTSEGKSKEKKEKEDIMLAI